MFSDEQVGDLADGLRGAASTDDDPQATPAENWQQITRYALAQAGIELTDEQFDRAWRAAWQRAFMGGNYTLDARAILAAVEVRSTDTTEDCPCATGYGNVCGDCPHLDTTGAEPTETKEE